MTLLRGGIHHRHPLLRTRRQPFIDRLRIVPQREQRFGGIDRGCRRGVLRGWLTGALWQADSSSRVIRHSGFIPLGIRYQLHDRLKSLLYPDAKLFELILNNICD